MLLVTWILSVMGVVALFLLYRSGAEWAAVNSLARRLNFQATAEDILHDCIVQLNADETDHDDKSDEWYNNGRFDEERNGYEVTVIIEDEGSKPNLNYVRNYRNLEIFLPAEEVPVAPLQDWLDSDSSAMENGAENPYYQGLDSPYKSRDGFLSSLEELKEIKNGKKLYAKLSSYFTVIGKANPNRLIAYTFSELLYSHGFDKFFVESAYREFSQYAQNNRFTNMDDFLQLQSVSVLRRDEMRPLFRFDGFCNLNMVDEKALKFIFKEIEVDENQVGVIMRRVKTDPFKNQENLNMNLEMHSKYQDGRRKFYPEDYFNVKTTIVRYKIWVKYKESTYFLNTVWERVPVSNKKTKWQSHPLSWRVLMNRETPKIPEKQEDSETAPTN